MGKRSGALVLLALALPLVPRTARAQNRPSGNLWTRSTELYLNQGLNANNDQDKARFLKEALEKATQAMQKGPDNPLAWQLAGKVYVALGDLAGADSALTRAEKLYPPYVKEDALLREQAWVEAYNAGVRALQADQTDQAVAAFEQANRLYQGKPSARMTLATIYQNKGDYDKAAEEYKGALDILQGPASKNLKPAEQKKWQEETQKVIARLGQLYVATKRYDQAVALLQPQIAANPKDVGLKVELARALALSGKDADAKAIFAEIATMPDLSDDQYVDAGVALFRSRDFPAAADAFRRAIGANPYNHGALYNLSQALLAQVQPIEQEREKAAPAARAPFAAKLAPLFAELNDVTGKFLALEPANGTALHLASATARGLANIAAKPADETANRNRALQLLQEAEKLPFEVSDANLTPLARGIKLAGTLTNKTLAAGAPMTLKVSFLGKDGSVLDTQNITVPAPARDETASFATVTVAKDVAGWKYELAQ